MKSTPAVGQWITVSILVQVEWSINLVPAPHRCKEVHASTVVFSNSDILTNIRECGAELVAFRVVVEGALLGIVRSNCSKIFIPLLQFK